MRSAPRRGSRGDERKPVTVLFTDVAGSTTLGERLEPEAVRQVMLRYFEAVAAWSTATGHGREVHRRRGDGRLRRADRARGPRAARGAGGARSCRQELTGLNDELQRQWGVQIAIRTGVNSGDVVAGDAAAGQALVTGDAVNVAARLQQAAAPGETLIGDATRRLVRRR